MSEETPSKEPTMKIDLPTANPLEGTGGSPTEIVPSDDKEDMKLMARIMTAEVLGETNKTPEQVLRDAEKECLGLPAAKNLHGEEPEEITEVAIPSCVKDALSEAIQSGSLPIAQPLISWMERKVAEFNLVDPDQIAANGQLITEGKDWSFYPELADIFTGFQYYPPEK